MATIDDINALLADNTANDITEADMRACFAKVLNEPMNITGAEIKALYELETDAFTDALKVIYDGAVLDIAATIPQVLANDVTIQEFKEMVPTLATKDFVGAVVINTFSGTTVPLDSLGKDDDRYREYPVSTSETLFSGTSLSDANPHFFVIAENIVGKAIDSIHIIPADNEVEFHANAPMEGMQMSVDGISVPLTLKESFSGFQVYSYSTTYDATIASIVTTSAIVVQSIVMSGEYKDFIKFDSHWIEWQHFSRPTVISAVSNNPTKAELITAFKLVPNMDWTHDHDFYVKDATGDKLLLVKYRSNGAISELSPEYRLFYETLTLAT